MPDGRVTRHLILFHARRFRRARVSARRRLQEPPETRAPIPTPQAPLPARQRTLLEVQPIVVATAIVDGFLEIRVVHNGRFDTDGMATFADHLAEAFSELGGVEPVPSGVRQEG